LTEIAFLPGGARLGLAIAAIALGALAVLLRRRRAGERWLVLAAAGAIVAVAILAAERLVAFAALGEAGDADFNEWRWVLLSPWGRVAILLGLAAAVAAVVLSWRGTARERSITRRAVLVGLRAGACAAALILFLEPAIELRQVGRERNHVVVLVDDSRSMGLAEGPGAPTRAERVARLLRASEGTLERWRRDHHVDFFTFSDGIEPAAGAELARELRLRGDATRIREALEQVRARYDGEDLAGIVLVSDGVPTGAFAGGATDGAARDFLAGLGARVHTVWTGRKGLKDLSVSRVGVDEFAFVRTVAKVEAQVRATGFDRRLVPVTLKRDGAVVATRTVTVGGDVPEARVTFEFTPERVGKYVYEISIPVAPGEAVTTNNSRAFVLRVIRDKIRVLQVAGRPSWDERALRALLKADPNVDLISFFILRTDRNIQMVPPSEMSLIPFPTEELFEHELGSFDIVVLMNFEFAPYGIAPYLDNMRRFVADGGGFAMLGGDQAFSSGQYFGTPVADVLPVELLPGGPSPGFRARIDAPQAPDPLVSTEEFVPRLTPEGARHPITQLRFDRKESEARWKGLPPLEGLNHVAGARSDATVLMTHPTLKTRTGAAMPVLAVGEHGQGRALALLTDSAWRWGFVAAGRPGDDGRAYSRFWENAIRWLIRDPDLEHLHVRTDRAEYSPGEAPRITARLVDRDYRPAPKAAVTVTVTPAGEAGARPLLEQKLSTDEAGEAHLDLEPPAPGAYRIAARASLGDRRLVADDVFLVHAERAELERPEAREDVLAAIASATGGKYLGEVASLDASLPFAPPRIVRVDRRTDVELWSRPWLFFLAVALLGLEWSLRRRRGYL
jgi:uncharacterized membrane protein